MEFPLSLTKLFLFSLMVSSSALPNHRSSNKREKALFAARDAISIAVTYFSSSLGPQDSRERDEYGGAWRDCAELYEDSEYRLRHLIADRRRRLADVRACVSGAATCHRSCMEGLLEQGLAQPIELSVNVTRQLTVALKVHKNKDDSEIIPNSNLNCKRTRDFKSSTNSTRFNELFNWKADVIVAKDGSGAYQTIKEAIIALSHWKRSSTQRSVIYVKEGTYTENIEIERALKNVMLVGDGIDKTIITGSRSVTDGYTTYRSATFGVSGDGFWARDVTFENSAGPGKHQAVALRVSSDLAIFHRCSFRGYQDTLFTHSLRQFFRDCDVYGTIDFIFGNSAAVFQNCNIFVRKPMEHQANMITAQGRDSDNEATGTCIHKSRILPAGDFERVKGEFSSFLGRPWKKYSRVVVMETEIDGMVSAKGWSEWSGDFALNTLFYGEYMNTGGGAATGGRISWRGFHVLKSAAEASPFTVGRFIQGGEWIPASGVPFWSGQ